MPHIVLEHSSNVDLPSDLSELFSTIHELLVEKLPTQLSACKSRVIKYGNFYLGDGDKNNGFVHLGVKIIKGREENLKVEVGEELRQILESYTRTVDAASALNLQISVEIFELETYTKT